MSNYFSAIAQLQESTWTDETALDIEDANRSQFFLQSRPTEKLVLFFHGFTALPEQFAVMATALFDAGYNVIVPRLPGHGIPGVWNCDNPPPLPQSISVYQEFALEWLENAQLLSQHIIVGGLSGGATLAAWLAMEKPETIDRTLLYAPYLNNNNGFINWVVETLNFYFQWQTADGAISFGYDGFKMPALKVFLDLGQAILEKSRTTPIAPSLILSSDADPTTPASDFEQLFQNIAQFHHPTWNVRFEPALNIPHNMMTKAEGNQYVDLVIEVTRLYLERSQPWEEAKPLIEQRIREIAAIAHP